MSLIDPKKRNLFLHVHYFGHFIDAQNSADFCQRYECLLIEDCAHIISPFVGMNFVGEFVFLLSQTDSSQVWWLVTRQK